MFRGFSFPHPPIQGLFHKLPEFDLICPIRSKSCADPGHCGFLGQISTSCASSTPPLTLSRRENKPRHFWQLLMENSLKRVSSTRLFAPAKCHPQMVVHSHTGMPQDALPTLCAIFDPLLLEMAQRGLFDFAAAFISMPFTTGSPCFTEVPDS